MVESLEPFPWIYLISELGTLLPRRLFAPLPAMALSRSLSLSLVTAGDRGDAIRSLPEILALLPTA